jgi:hypothetical protein
MKHEPGVESIRSYLYQDQKSAAHIDVDIVPRIDFHGTASYIISMFAGPTKRNRTLGNSVAHVTARLEIVYGAWLTAFSP